MPKKNASLLLLLVVVVVVVVSTCSEENVYCQDSVNSFEHMLTDKMQSSEKIPGDHFMFAVELYAHILISF